MCLMRCFYDLGEFSFGQRGWTDGRGRKKRPAKTQYGASERIICAPVWAHFREWGALRGWFTVGGKDLRRWRGSGYSLRYVSEARDSSPPCRSGCPAKEGYETPISVVTPKTALPFNICAPGRLRWTFASQ
jgi:hypothetical protein